MNSNITGFISSHKEMFATIYIFYLPHFIGMCVNIDFSDCLFFMDQPFYNIDIFIDILYVYVDKTYSKKSIFKSFFQNLTTFVLARERNCHKI